MLDNIQPPTARRNASTSSSPEYIAGARPASYVPVSVISRGFSVVKKCTYNTVNTHSPCVAEHFKEMNHIKPTGDAPGGLLRRLCGIC
jgi:hypothetical protein